MQKHASRHCFLVNMCIFCYLKSKCLSQLSVQMTLVIFRMNTVFFISISTISMENKYNEIYSSSFRPVLVFNPMIDISSLWKVRRSACSEQVLSVPVDDNWGGVGSYCAPWLPREIFWNRVCQWRWCFKSCFCLLCVKYVRSILRKR